MSHWDHDSNSLERRMRSVAEQLKLLAEAEKKQGEHTASTVWSMAAEMVMREIEAKP